MNEPKPMAATNDKTRFQTLKAWAHLRRDANVEEIETLRQIK